jgi:outer membrane protein TolC
MLDILRRQFGHRLCQPQRRGPAGSGAGAGRKATLPPLRKALQQNRDLLSALRVLSQRGTARDIQARRPAFADRSAGQPAVATDRAKPDVRAAQEQLHSASAQIGVATANIFRTSRSAPMPVT